MEKFKLLENWGDIVVPNNFGSDYTEEILRKNEKKFSHLENHKSISDRFIVPIIRPFDRFSVYVYEQKSYETTTLERIKFHKEIGSERLGIHGLTMVLDQKIDKIDQNFWYSSLSIFPLEFIPCLNTMENKFKISISTGFYPWGEGNLLLIFKKI